MRTERKVWLTWSYEPRDSKARSLGLVAVGGMAGKARMQTLQGGILVEFCGVGLQLSRIERKA